jgi:hypothetical protein
MNDQPTRVHRRVKTAVPGGEILKSRKYPNVVGKMKVPGLDERIEQLRRLAEARKPLQLPDTETD